MVPTATKRILRRRFPGTCETVGQVFKCVWRLLKNKCCLYVIITIRLFSITICNLLIDLPSYLHVLFLHQVHFPQILFWHTLYHRSSTPRHPYHTFRKYQHYLHSNHSVNATLNMDRVGLLDSRGTKFCEVIECSEETTWCK